MIEWSSIWAKMADLIEGRSIRYMFSLLHRVIWGQSATYRDVAMKYVSYVTNKYGAPVIVFDGYEEEYNIKDMTHKPCYGDKISTIVTFTEDIVLFLRNNKINRNSSICWEDISENPPPPKKM